MQRCPCCNARLNEAVSCPRCKAELQDIIQVQQLAKSWYQQAINCYLNKDLQASQDAITRSLQLYHSESALQFKAFVIDRQEKMTGLFRLKRFLQSVAEWSLLLVKHSLDNYHRFSRMQSK